MADLIEIIILIVLFIRIMDGLATIVNNQVKIYEKLKKLGVKDDEH